MRLIRTFGWIAFGMIFGTLAALWLVALMGAAFGVGEALYLFSRYSLSWKTIAIAVEGEWFWLSNFVILFGWPSALVGAFLGLPAVNFLAYCVRHLYRISGTIQPYK